MRAVWSFWSKPYLLRRSWRWRSDLNYLLAWVLSVETARRHYPDTELVTDKDGAAMLLDGAGLHFEKVSTALEDLSSADPDLWTLGKLFTLRMQDSPFVHIDPDCFLWSPLPDRLAFADVFAQSPEPVTYDGSTYYNGQVIKEAVEGNQGWLPEEMAWFLSARGRYLLNTGIVGGNRVDFIRHYADRAISAALHPANGDAWSSVEDKTHLISVIEQGTLSACIEYHRGRAGSIFTDLKPERLFRSAEEAKDPEAAKRAGFTHLLGTAAKRDEHVQARLQARVERDYPEQAERCARFVLGRAEVSRLPMEQGMNVVNVSDLEAQRFPAHGGSGQIRMKFAFPEENGTAGARRTSFGVALFPKGSSAGLHRHVGSEEWFYVLSGSATLVVDGRACRIASGDIVLTRDGSSHEILDVSDPLALIVIEVRTAPL